MVGEEGRGDDSKGEGQYSYDLECSIWNAERGCQDQSFEGLTYHVKELELCLYLRVFIIGRNMPRSVYHSNG